MRLLLFILFSFVMLQAKADPSPTPCRNPPKSVEYYADQVLVTFNGGVDEEIKTRVLKKYAKNIKPASGASKVPYFHVISKLKHKRSVAEVIEMISKESCVKSAQPNYIYRVN